MKSTLPRHSGDAVNEAGRVWRWENGGRLVPARFQTPRGVKLRILAEGEINREPVLVCQPCSGPTLHVLALDLAGAAVCKECGVKREW